MPAKDLISNSSTRRIELIFSKLDSLSILPAVAFKSLEELNSGNLNRNRLLEIIEADPVLYAKFNSTLNCKSAIDIQSSTRKTLLDELSDVEIQEMILSFKVVDLFDHTDSDENKALTRTELTYNSLALACCSEMIAKMLGMTENDQRLAFFSGLLLNVGKLAIDEALPKSYFKIATEAKIKRTSIARIERKYLGIDHSLIGKKLAEKWHLSQEISSAIWLYQKNEKLETLQNTFSDVTKTVQLAYLLVRNSRFGNCGDYDQVKSPLPSAIKMGLDETKLEAIKIALDQAVEEKAAILGLKTSNSAHLYCDSIRKNALNTLRARKLSESDKDNRALNKMISDFIAASQAFNNSNEASCEFLKKIQQTLILEKACICLFDKAKTGCLDTFYIDSNNNIDQILIKTPDIDLQMWQELSKGDFLESFEGLNWLLNSEKLGFSPADTYAILLRGNKTPAGVLVFELCNKADFNADKRDLKKALDMFASVLNLFQKSDRNADLAEKFAQAIAELKDAQEEICQLKSFLGIAEMAAGAAHELNNPLAVISGRAQILMGIEQDEKKLSMLRQIQQRSDEIKQIVNTLMDFAKPNKPMKRSIALQTILDGAFKQCVSESGLDNIDVTYVGMSDLPAVNVDSQQMVIALKNIFNNALESYEQNVGPIIVSGVNDSLNDCFELKITDYGSGMEEKTILNATKPFYSDKPAGRKQGMGLAVSKRLITLNNGQLSLESVINKGTTVKIQLPLS